MKESTIVALEETMSYAKWEPIWNAMKYLWIGVRIKTLNSYQCYSNWAIQHQVQKMIAPDSISFWRKKYIEEARDDSSVPYTSYQEEDSCTHQFEPSQTRSCASQAGCSSSISQSDYAQMTPYSIARSWLIKKLG